MGYTTWKFSNLSNRFLLDFYAWTVSVWKPLHFWSLEWHGKTWFQIGPLEFMYHPQPQSRRTPRALDAALCVCQKCGEASELSSQRCSVCNTPRQ